MAMIKCHECGKEISDKASSCPNCGCPLSEMITSGIVKIKIGVLKASTGLNGNQKVSILSNSRVLWEGNVGDIAEIHFSAATNITVQYHLSLMHFGGECSGIIDPIKSRKYSVSARQGIMSTKLVLQEVDIFDAD